ncbi:NADPH:quinone oxidoreductase family protein [Phreatobacter sp. AB_2022a]|uniref:NADPH:quinone oxidoreductase family protein n=1 Tax=Phreatobacter sp. AB_2022a TaxID=3003134 RepID=UPI002286CEB2|nr:NADPH:quinone oxidoreductase family protein [Phreatobacter sp. AB_2022a]MCZ0736325.1 NADPH:quinone oxidoreductase family protein [Phreatobacter sp. AB_2022a]
MMTSATMRAWRSTTPGLDNLALVTVPRPEFGAGEALVRVESAALNFSDLLMIDDRYQVRPPRPFTPGQELGGTVVAAGPDSGLAPGDRVASKVLWGGFAEYAAVRGDMAIRVPDGVATATATALPVVYTTAMVALTESTAVKPGETVLVLAAAGGVGLAAVEIARDLGARVIAAAGGDDKCALARRHGAHEAIDYRREGWGAEVKALTGGRGADVIVDPVGGEATREAMRVLAWEGRLMIVGFASGDIPQIRANHLLLKRATAVGVYWNHDHDGAMLARVAGRLAGMLGSGAIRPHIGGTFAFDALPDALKCLAGRGSAGKLVLNLVEETAP